MTLVTGYELSTFDAGDADSEDDDEDEGMMVAFTASSEVRFINHPN